MLLGLGYGSRESPLCLSNKGNQFAKLIILERTVKDKGTAKLTVGVKPDGTLVQYCITAAQGDSVGCNLATC